MDETTKVLIGTISGFVIAFLSEPIKTYIQNISRRNNLRRILYQEALENLLFLRNIEGDEGSGATFIKVASNVLKMDGYKYAMSNEIEIYYQLKEAPIFNVLYSAIQHLLQINLSPENRDGLIKLYTLKITKAIKSGDLSIKYLRKIKSKEQVKIILKELKLKMN